MVRSKTFQIFLHTIAWLLFFFLPFILLDKPISGFHNDVPFPQHPRIMGLVVINLAFLSFFYLNYLLLFPQLFVRKKFLFYLLSLMGFTLLFFGVQDYIRFFFIDTPTIIRQTVFRPVQIGPGLFMFFLVAILSTGIKITEEWFKSEQKNKEIENDKLNAELSSLKSQINPHFLFNALNTIYSLTITEPSKASEALMKLSKMMRYVMEDSQGNLVQLKQEITHLENFIAFQKLRANEKLKIDYNIVTDDISKYRIAPLILVAFIENAFKYGISSHEDCVIKIELIIEESKLSFHITNKVFQTQSLAGKETNIGINNTKRRLALIYPDMHEFKIVNNDGHYSIELIILLS